MLKFFKNPLATGDIFYHYDPDELAYLQELGEKIHQRNREAETAAANPAPGVVKSLRDGKTITDPEMRSKGYKKSRSMVERLRERGNGDRTIS